MRRIFFLTLFVIIYPTKFNFAHSISPDVFIQSTVNRASQILSKDISKDEKMNQLKLIAKETVDIRGIGFYSLGSARKNLNENQKKNYSDLFENYFLKIF
jgi:phospholipid transport system substrate-binding protein